MKTSVSGRQSSRAALISVISLASLATCLGSDSCDGVWRPEGIGASPRGKACPRALLSARLRLEFHYPEREKLLGVWFMCACWVQTQVGKSVQVNQACRKRLFSLDVPSGQILEDCVRLCPLTRCPSGPKLSNVGICEAPLCSYHLLWLWRSRVLRFVIVATLRCMQMQRLCLLFTWQRFEDWCDCCRGVRQQETFPDWFHLCTSIPSINRHRRRAEMSSELSRRGKEENSLFFDII